MFRTIQAHLWDKTIDARAAQTGGDRRGRRGGLLTARVISSIAPTIERAEIDRLKQRPTDSADSYDTYLRGLALTYQRRFAESRSLFKEAAERNPEFAVAYAASARTYSLEQAHNGVIPTQEVRADALRDMETALGITNDDALVLAACSHPMAYICGFRGKSATDSDLKSATDSDAKPATRSGAIRPSIPI